MSLSPAPLSDRFNARVLSAARDGTREELQDLKTQGADITAKGEAFAAAFYAGNEDTMRYLAAQGMNIYAPAIIAGMSSPATPAETKDAYRKLLREDERQHELYCAYVSPPHPDFNDLRNIPYGTQEQGLTLMHLMARTGQAEDIARLAKAEWKKPPRAEDFLKPDKDGVSVLAILAARGEGALLLDRQLWRQNPAARQEIADALDAMQKGRGSDPQSHLSELHYHRLRKKADPARWSLGPKNPPKP